MCALPGLLSPPHIDPPESAWRASLAQPVRLWRPLGQWDKSTEKQRFKFFSNSSFNLIEINFYQIVRKLSATCYEDYVC